MSKENGRLEGMNEKLYSRTRYKAPEDLREPIAPVDYADTKKSWDTPSLDELLQAERIAAEGHPLLRKIFITAVVFFVCATAAATLIYFGGNNFISTRNLEISVSAPTIISAASPVDIELIILNKNNASLSQVNLTISYPEGTRDAEDSNTPLSEVRETIASISPGERVTRNERAVFLGSAGEVKTALITVTYKVAGSNATFTKEKPFEFTIGSAPVTVSIVRPERVTSGEVWDAVISISANSEEVLRGVSLRAEYPFGFSLSSSAPETTNVNRNEWLLGDLSPGGKKTVTLRGVLLGEDGDERTFRFFVGTGETLLSADFMVVEVRRPALDLSVRLNGDSASEYVAPAGREIRAVITIKNNLPENILSPQVEARFSGNALDKLSVNTQGGGFYNSSQGSVVWNSSNSSIPNSLAPGETMTFSLNFASMGGLLSGTSNQRIDLNFSLSGRAQNTNTNLRVTDARSVKIASEVSLSSRSLYSRGPFTNTGSIPPKAESETTYTIGITLGNTRNDIVDGRVMGTLGANVEWLGNVFGEGVNVTYDESTRTVIWHLESLQSGVGFSLPAREAFFQVALTPSLGQVGGEPILLNNIIFIGMDTFTNAEVRTTNQALTTRISLDPNYVQGDEIVVK